MGPSGYGGGSTLVRVGVNVGGLVGMQEMGVWQCVHLHDGHLRM